MDRRHFSVGLAATALFGGPAAAQQGPVEGRDYTRLRQPVPVSAPAGKVEVVEFFGYWCPHCNAFEPTLDAWARSLPPHVVFRRLPVAFNAAQVGLQKLYLALEVLGQVDAVHRKVFAAIHLQHQHLNADGDFAAFGNANGLDGAKLVQTMASFSVVAKAKQMQQLAEAYRIDGVPTLGVQGRYLTSPSLAGGHERALAVADALVRSVTGG